MEALLKNFALSVIDAEMILVGMVLFFVFTRLFGKKVVAPHIELIEAREAAIEGARGEAVADIRAAAELDREFEARVAHARVGAITEKMKVVDVARKEASRLNEQAEAEARQILDTERAALARSLNELRAGAKNDEDSLVQMVVRKFGVEGAGRQ